MAGAVKTTALVAQWTVIGTAGATRARERLSNQGFWPDGLHAAPTDDALAYDLKAHKKLGFDSVRLGSDPVGNNQSGLNLGADGGAGDIMDEHGYPSPALPPRPDGERVLVTGEYSGSRTSTSPRRPVPTTTSPSWPTLISDVEGELNGLLAYDRAVLKPDAARLEAGHEALIRDASRVTPTGCPAPQPVLK